DPMALPPIEIAQRVSDQRHAGNPEGIRATSPFGTSATSDDLRAQSAKRRITDMSGSRKTAADDPTRTCAPSPGATRSWRVCWTIISAGPDRITQNPLGAAMEQIADWLEKLGLGQYAQRFAENDINFGILPHLTDQDLKRAWGRLAWSSAPAAS